MAFRGYISSRPFGGQRVPQHIQNLVIRDYCQRNDLHFLLSATELAMPNSFLMLAQLQDDIEKLDGIVFYSLGQLPEEEKQRVELFRRIISARRRVHFSMEGLCVADWESAKRVEQILQVQLVVPACLSTEGLRLALRG
jgi:sporadic carbohydrate cluster protein (TIGR04323 family)